MAQTDDIARLAAIQFNLLVAKGAVRDLRKLARLELGEVGKACGTTGDLVAMWEDGLASPTTQQALACMALLTSRAAAQRGSYTAQIRTPTSQGNSFRGALNLTEAAE